MTIPRILTLAALCALPLLSPISAKAQDGDEDEGSSESSGSELDMEALMNSINLGSDSSAGGEVSYEGRLSSSAPNFASGKAVTITHTGGSIAIRCMDAPGITARLGYTVFGTNKVNM